jgi:hypothetical protein
MTIKEYHAILAKHTIDVASGALKERLEAKFGLGAFEEYMSGKSRVEILQDRKNKKGSK